MANTSSIRGFVPVKTIDGSPYNGAANLYYVASAADELFVGDIVKRASTADATGIAGADLCGASDMPIGVVVGIMPSNFSPVGKLSTGDTALSFPGNQRMAVSGTGYILVADDPNIIMEVEAANGTPAIVDIGLNASHANGTRIATTAVCPAYIDMATEAVTATLNFYLLGFVQRPDNEVGASAKLLVGFNVHSYKSVGTLGIA